MLKSLVSKSWPHAVSLLVIVVLSFIYCSPVLDGKVIVQSDILKNRAQSEEIREFREKTGEEPLWTSRVFSGMTTFNISTLFKTNITGLLHQFVAAFPSGVNLIIASCAGFYLLLVLLGVNHWLALAGALGYGLSSNLLISIMAGHNTKVLGIAYMAPALGGVLLAYRGKILGGLGLVAAFVALMVYANHYQIIYYFLLLSLVIGVSEAVYAFKQKQLPAFVKTSAMLLIAGIIGFMPNFSKVYNVYTHSTETIRGGQKHLNNNEKADEGGLGKGYAMSWSISQLESFTVLVPNMMGGASSEEALADGSLKAMLRAPRNGQALLVPTYTGDQPFTMGPAYFGAAFIFLFVFAFFMLDNRTRVWIVAGTVLSFFIAWGKHFDVFTGFLFEYFPLYNKFRTPSMALCMAGLLMPLMAMLGLQQAMAGDGIRTTKALKWASGITGGVLLLLLLYGFNASWVGAGDAELLKRQPWDNDLVYQALLSDRRSMFMSDWTVSAFVAFAAVAILFLHTLHKFSAGLVGFAMVLLLGGDSWRVSKRYLNADNFISKRQMDNQFAPSLAEQEIKQDGDPHFRVLNLSRNPWTDGMTCAHLANVGGHHAAKLQRYQDIIENQFASQLPIINKAVMQSGQSLSMVPEQAARMTAYNMLNTKYYILDEQRSVMNPAACGNAWFVSETTTAADGAEEMAKLSEINPLQTAVVSPDVATALGTADFATDSTSVIKLTKFAPNRLAYESTNSADGLAVFSEVFYSNGWHATIDGAPAEIHRVNYLLRAIKVPAGKHQIEMWFQPESYAIGERVSLAGSAAFVGFLSLLMWMANRARRNEKAA